MDIRYPIEAPHALAVDEVLQAFQTDASSGLSAEEVALRTKLFGLNVYQAQGQKSIWRMLLQQFVSPIVYLLFVGAAISFYFRDYMEAIAIMVVLLINALIGFFMELQARNSMRALKEMDVIHTKVIRDGKILEIPSEQITPGDVVLFEAGDVIPGDGRLIALNQLQCDESALTGESLPSKKSTDKLPPNTALGDRLNMVFKGTSVMNGNGKAVITAIAQHTQLGKITSLVASASETVTPLDKRLNDLSRKLIWVTLSLTAVFAITGFIQGKALVLILKTSIALAVAAIPEGLPIVATIALAYGMLLMARRNAIVKKLSSVETLGSTSVILTDKTGTLTENNIHVETLSFPEEERQVSIRENALIFENGAIQKSLENFEKLLLIGTLCNNAPAETATEKVTGDPIEIALVRLTNASGMGAEALRKQYKRIAEIPFSSEAKIMGTLHKSKHGLWVAAKGSAEYLLEKCNKVQRGSKIDHLDEKTRLAIKGESESMAAKGSRVLAFAYQEGASFNEADFLTDLIYVGMIGFLDPPRLDIKDAIASCKKAGIKIVMITGDHPLTALNIARKTGLLEDGESAVVTGMDLPAMNDMSQTWKEKILSTSIFARTTPQQKLDIATLYQEDGNIVAMTGDGVNDAPALKKADIGIAMGKRGTQVAKETADIVLKDDSFTSITAAVAHGRVIFRNIKKFVVYLVSCNLSEIFIVTILGFLAPASTLLPLQILFLNVVTDVFPALVLGVGKGDTAIMKIPPKDPDKSIVSKSSWIAIVAYAIVMTLAVVLAVFYCREAMGVDEHVANNVAFITLILAQLFHVFNMSSANSPLVVNEITKNKFIWLALLLCSGLLLLVFQISQLRMVLNLAHLPAKIWGICFVASLLPLLGIQAYKRIGRWV